MPFIIKINIDNTMENINININNTNKLNKLLEISNNKGENNISELYTWNNKISVYGWTSGIDNKNKHKLPPGGISTTNKIPSEKMNLYGNIFIIAFNKNKIINYNISEYGELHYILTLNDSDKEFSNSDSEDDNINNNLDNILLDKDLTEYK